MIDKPEEPQDPKLTTHERLKLSELRLEAALLREKKLKELLQFGRNAVRSAAGNLVAFDEKVTELFKEVVEENHT